MKDRRAIVRDAKKHSANAFTKFRQAQDQYLAANRAAFSSGQLESVRVHLDALSTKFILAQVHLEELWTESETHRLGVLDLIGSDVTAHIWDDEDLLLTMLSFESYLFQARSYIDLFLLYACLVFGIESPGRMSRKRFRQRMRAVDEPHSAERALRFLDYVEQNVFGQNQWGAVLKSLRDRVAHRDIVRPGREGWEEVAGVLLDWPTIQGLSLERLGQTFDNGSFELMTESTEMLFNSKWVTGPARSA